ncbi:MAG: hypothetical protein MN733_32205 [Nitrososphaera sp.]|nr:hypothetical protein [Nitrososphaera sp.]
MKRDDFFRGLFATLALKDQTFIETRRDIHHKRFQNVVRELAKQKKAAHGVDLLFVPSAFTGRYRELNDALLRLQRGMLGAQNPFYPGVNLDISKERANCLLEEFSSEERILFSKLADAFLKKIADELQNPHFQLAQGLAR